MRMYIRLLSVIFALVLTQSLSAARARGGWRECRQPDGTTLAVTLCGDEHFHYYKTADEAALLFDQEQGGFCYARPSASGIVSTGRIAHEQQLRTDDERLSLVRTDALRPLELMAAASARRRILGTPATVWDAERTYRQPVLLVEFSNCSFSMDDPKRYYERLFNEKGYNEGRGPGCAADYFRAQSGGRLNLSFDVYGPVKLPNSATTNGNWGSSKFREAVQQLAALGADFTPYDWNADGLVEQLIIVYAGYGGNENSSLSDGRIWPNTDKFAAVTVGGAKASVYSASAELWVDDTRCGLGTICHEFSHCLGLPDIYPTSSSSSEYSVADEWDLMDGGNFIDNGWCPCNYSVHEKMLFGWIEPVELTAPVEVKDLKPVEEGGEAYIIRHTDSEFFLLENRQWAGWDALTPGHGLLVWHVNYLASEWAANRVNNGSTHRYELVHADNLDYTAWAAIAEQQGRYYQGGHSRILSTTPYPYAPAEGQANRELADEALYGIEESDGGLVSFRYMQKEPSAVVDAHASGQTRRVLTTVRLGRGHRLTIERRADGSIGKTLTE